MKHIDKKLKDNISLGECRRIQIMFQQILKTSFYLFHFYQARDKNISDMKHHKFIPFRTLFQTHIKFLKL